MTQPVAPPKKVVWIKCRAPNGHGCEGNQAEVVFTLGNIPVGSDGSFTPEAGGRTIRYRCLTCKNSFHIHS